MARAKTSFGSSQIEFWLKTRKTLNLILFEILLELFQPYQV